MHLGSGESGAREPGDPCLIVPTALPLQNLEQAGAQHTELHRQIGPVKLTRKNAQGLQATEQTRLREEDQAHSMTPRECPEGPLVRFEQLGLRGVLQATFGTTLLRA